MKLVKRPKEFNMISLTPLLVLPVLAINLWVVYRGQIGNIELRTAITAGIFVGSWVAAVVLSTRRAHSWGLYLFALGSICWTLVNAVVLFRTRNYALAFFVLFQLILAVLYLVHMKKLLSEAYYSSGRRWFEGLPRFVAHVSGSLKVGDNEVPVRVSRLDQKGCFIYPERQIKAQGFKSLSLKYADLHLESDVDLISVSAGKTGFGVKFKRQSLDDQKDVADFLDRVRSAGYVP